MSENNLKNKKVDWRVFAWAMGIILLLISTAFAQMNRIHGRVDDTNGRINVTNGTVNEINGDIKAIKTDISWIKETLQANIK